MFVSKKHATILPINVAFCMHDLLMREAPEHPFEYVAIFSILCGGQAGCSKLRPGGT